MNRLCRKLVARAAVVKKAHALGDLPLVVREALHTASQVKREEVVPAVEVRNARRVLSREGLTAFGVPAVDAEPVAGEKADVVAMDEVRG